MNKKSLKNFTILEEVFGISILLIVLLIIISLYVKIELLTNLMGDFTKVIASVEKKMEEIKIEDFSNITNQTFDIEGFSSNDAKGRVIVSGSSYYSTSYYSNSDYSNLTTVKIVACFKSRGRLIGDSIDNCSSSPIELVTQIAKFTTD